MNLSIFRKVLVGLGITSLIAALILELSEKPNDIIDDELVEGDDEEEPSDVPNKRNIAVNINNAVKQAVEQSKQRHAYNVPIVEEESVKSDPEMDNSSAFTPITEEEYDTGDYTAVEYWDYDPNLHLLIGSTKAYSPEEMIDAEEEKEALDILHEIDIGDFKSHEKYYSVKDDKNRPLQVCFSDQETNTAYIVSIVYEEPDTQTGDLADSDY